ncbi:MAG: YiiD C-terminal domain-containing protein [Verrucomicrobia bacterium]|nr:YiiD C-terminal domain-containing protein [Verrucomicrobiota bacterium]
MTSHLAALKKKLRAEIPATRRLKIEPARCDDGALVFKAPLAPNRNDKGTAFAGSLCAIATLAGWSALWLALRDAGLQGIIVIQDGSIRYLRPVTRDFEARCPWPEPAQLARLFAALRRLGRARLRLRVVICENGVEAVTFTGRYVVLISK